ncbi:hypothetical protein PVK06_018037 [Gossypium arboreum]|uniref:RNase H type-1 domain-containing protein n=1 Tax=Gossypium arboreum TaxID=29729 RepID=A0ABR0Q4D2_GOSAR|nr:hypothetical protein PVK06_018037 [Gossypium arboreum]
MNSDWAETMAFEEGVNLSKNLNLKRVNFESDNANIVDITFLGQCAKETYAHLKAFESAVITGVPRSGNRLADFICNFVLKINCAWVFYANYPKEIHDIVIQDAINEI